jgi:cytochrome c553
MNRLIFFATVWFLMAVGSQTAAAGGDPAAGEQKAAACAACHGPDGNSVDPQFPVIAGQVRGYIADSLAAFKSGERPNAIMMGMSQPLSEQDMADLDAFYSAQAAAPRSITDEQLESARAGEAIYRGGYRPMDIPACMSCHGPAGQGIPTQYPRLAGQHPGYLEAQLNAYKTKQRPNPVMGPIAFLLTEEQIASLSLYISALQ